MDVHDETPLYDLIGHAPQLDYGFQKQIDDFEKPIEKPKKMKKEEKSKMDELLADMEATFSS